MLQSYIFLVDKMVIGKYDKDMEFEDWLKVRNSSEGHENDLSDEVVFFLLLRAVLYESCP